MTLRDNPRPPGYWPNTPSQWREATVDDCTWYSAEFLWEAAGDDHMSVHPVRWLRNKSSDKYGGTPPSLVVSETLRIWPSRDRVVAKIGWYTRDYITTALLSGAGIMWNGEYRRLPSHYRTWTHNDDFSHTMASLRLDERERTFLYDPLGGGTERDFYNGEWIQIDELLRFNWENGNDGYYVGVVQNEGDYTMKHLHLPVHQEADKVVTVRRGARARVSPRITSDTVRGFWNEERRHPFLAKFKDGWYLLLWSEGEDWGFGYVYKDDILSVESVEVEPPQPPTEVDCTETEEELAVANQMLSDIRDIVSP